MKRSGKARTAHDENSACHRIAPGHSWLVRILREDSQGEVGEGRTQGADREPQVGEEA